MSKKNTVTVGYYWENGRNYYGNLMDRQYIEEGLAGPNAEWIEEREIETPASVLREDTVTGQDGHPIILCANRKCYYLDNRYGKGGVSPWWRECESAWDLESSDLVFDEEA